MIILGSLESASVLLMLIELFSLGVTAEDSDYSAIRCHAGQQPMTRLSRRRATTTRFSPKAARNRRRQGIANIYYLASTHQMAPQHTSDQTGLLLIYRPRKDEMLSWPIVGSPVGCRPSAGQGQFASQRPRSASCAAQPTLQVNNSTSN